MKHALTMALSSHARCLLCAASALALSSSYASPASDVASNVAVEDKYLETIKVSDNIYVFKPKIDWVHGNGVAIIGPDGVFFIDTYLQFNYAEEAIRRLRKVTALPVRYVLNTHWHNDHVMGNAVFKRMYPESHNIVAASAVSFFDKIIAPAVQNEATNIRQTIAVLDSEIAVGRATGRSVPLVGPLRQFWQLQLQEATEYQQHFHPERYAPPDITFGDTLSMQWGAQTLRMIHMPDNGHSTGDVIVWIPESRLLVAGDLVVGPTPYATYQNIPGMISSIHKLIELNPAIIIPGHGVVEHDLSYLHLLNDAFTTYTHAAEQAVAAKVAPATAADSIAFPEIDRSFTDGDAVKEWAYRAFFARNVILYTYKAAGALPAPKPKDG